MTSPLSILNRAYRTEKLEQPWMSQPSALETRARAQSFTVHSGARQPGLHFTDQGAEAWQGSGSGWQTQNQEFLRPGTSPAGGDRPWAQRAVTTARASVRPSLTAPFEVQRMGLAPPKQAVNQKGERKLSTQMSYGSRGETALTLWDCWPQPYLSLWPPSCPFPAPAGPSITPEPGSCPSPSIPPPYPFSIKE